MRIEARYEIGQEVWVMDSIGFLAIPITIGFIDIHLEKQAKRIKYGCAEFGNMYKECDVYPQSGLCARAIRALVAEFEAARETKEAK